LSDRLQKPFTDESQWALVPVKSLIWTKQRLKTCLGSARAGLTLAMLKDVLTALAGSQECTHIAVVTADPQVVDIATACGALVIDEVTPGGMNEAIEQGVNAIRDSGGLHVAIIPSDVPLITSAEIDRVLQQFQDQRLAESDHMTGIVPSKDLGGTNLLCIETDRRISLMYGPDSYRRHSRLSVEQGIPCVSLRSQPIALDIDEEEDLDAFVSFCLSNPAFQHTETWKYLRGMGYVNPDRQEEKVYEN
jgi:2-phospho-L-lactate guanylyltransferase